MSTPRTALSPVDPRRPQPTNRARHAAEARAAPKPRALQARAQQPAGGDAAESRRAPRPRTKTCVRGRPRRALAAPITAALDGDYAAVERCLLRGDRTDARDADGKRAADIAAERGHTEIAALIAAWQAAPGLSEQTRREVTDARREARARGRRDAAARERQD